ncbi:MAG: carbon starvation protein A [Candidatus Binatia bacterium]
MNIGLFMLFSVLVLLMGYRFYGRYLARLAGVNPENPTPAVRVNDGVDYVPTKGPVVFSHHFASIAAAGPIVGPTLAVFYGYVPTWLWIILGVIFIGAVHDFMALFVSLQEGGRSIAEVARRTLGEMGFIFFISFAILFAVLVSAAFFQLTAIALTSLYSLEGLGLSTDQTLIKTVVRDGQTYAQIGGIASTSVVMITLLAPTMGYLLHKRDAKVWAMSLLALVLCAASVAVGLRYPVSLNPVVWMGIIAVYTFFASWVPVWIILQPRDFVNVHLLYIGLLAMVVGIVGSGAAGVRIDAPAFNLTAESISVLGGTWPFLFVTIACGACSGGHALIASGTTCKQISSEKHAPIIGYGGMLLEALLAICVTIVIVAGLGFSEYKTVVWGEGNAPLAFALGVGKTLNHVGIPTIYGTIFGILMLEGFLITTLDTTVRFTRYLLEELWTVVLTNVPTLLKNRFVNTGLVIGLIAGLGFSNGYKAIWPIFGSANQLLAALTLIAVTAWLLQKARKVWFVALPAAFMTLTTLASLISLLMRYAEEGNWILTLADVLLLLLALGVMVMTARYFFSLRGAVVAETASASRGPGD